MNEIILSKSSSENELKQYFTAVLELSKSDNKFPINLDEVWMLAYPRKDDAVRELVSSFVEGDDYTIVFPNKSQVPGNQLLPKNEEQGLRNGGGQNKKDYYLSVACMEYFVAKKVKPVFEVYRQVFHRTAETKVLPSTYKDALKQLLFEVEEKERLQLENQEKQVQLEEKEYKISLQEKEIKEAAPKVQYFDQTMQSTNTLTTTQVAKSIGMEAWALNKKLEEIGIQFKQSCTWMLRSPYSQWGLHSTRTTTFTRQDGTVGTETRTVWKEKGRMFIVALSKNNWNVTKTIDYIKGQKEEETQLS